MRKQILQKFLLLSLTLVFLLPTTASQAAGVSPEKLQEVGSIFVCNCNCGTQIDALDESQCPTAKVFRKEIAQMLAEGKSKEEIRDYYVSQFGESILRAPLKSGFSLTAWVVPFVSLGAAGGGIWLLIQRRMRRSHPTLSENRDEMTAMSSVESEVYQEMIERERKKYL